MSRMLESLESRTLLSASPIVIKADLDALHADGVKAKADLTSALATAKSDVSAIKADVAAASLTAMQKQTLATLNAYETLGTAKYKAKVLKLFATGDLSGTRLDVALLSLKAHPGSSAARARALKALSALQKVFSTTAVSALESFASTIVTAIDSDLNTLATAVPAAQTDVDNAETHLQNDLLTLSNDATTIQTGVAKLAGDLAL